MNPPENIPLGEAVARGIIPCAVCGAQGADVRKVGARSHFLCAKCARRGQVWTFIVVALAVAALGLAGFLLTRPRTLPEDPRAPGNAGPTERVVQDIVSLLDQKQYLEARVKTQRELGPFPKRPELNLLMGQALMGLKAYETAIPYFKTAHEAGPPTRDQAALWLGLCLKTMGRSQEALKYVEPVTELNRDRRSDLAEVYLDLERYDDALKLLPETPDTLWARHRALLYLGKGAEARKLVEGRDAFILAGQLREEGDFAGAARILDSETGTRAKRAQMSLAVESGDLEKLAGIAAGLPPEDAAFARAMGDLLAGAKDKAKASAWEFLAKSDQEFAPLRLERMMMRHLVGELKDADLEAEAALLSRFHANDLYWYLALATGDRARAEKALASTPGHNYPYHAIRRLLKK